MYICKYTYIKCISVCPGRKLPVPLAFFFLAVYTLTTHLRNTGGIQTHNIYTVYISKISINGYQLE